MRVLLLITVVAGLASADADLDNSIDLVLSNLRALLQTNGQTTLPLPDLRGQVLGGLVKVHCWDGTISGLDTLNRTGPWSIKVLTPGKLASMQGSIGLGEFNITFAKCQISIFNVIKKTEKVSFFTNGKRGISLTLNVSIVQDGLQCHAKIEKLSVDYLGRVKLVTSGLLHLVKDQLVTWMVNLLKKVILPLVYNTVRNTANDVLDNYNLCLLGDLPFNLLPSFG